MVGKYSYMCLELGKFSFICGLKLAIGGLITSRLVGKLLELGWELGKSY